MTTIPGCIACLPLLLIFFLSRDSALKVARVVVVVAVACSQTNEEGEEGEGAIQTSDTRGRAATNNKQSLKSAFEKEEEEIVIIVISNLACSLLSSLLP